MDDYVSPFPLDASAVRYSTVPWVLIPCSEGIAAFRAAGAQRTYLTTLKTPAELWDFAQTYFSEAEQRSQERLARERRPPAFDVAKIEIDFTL
jgi:alpha-D-ribose 1-methylphosphonate 5-triphosphate synthase subunit PhnL